MRVGIAETILRPMYFNNDIILFSADVLSTTHYATDSLLFAIGILTDFGVEETADEMIR